MTDKEVFEKFMSWMNMKPNNKKDIDNTTVVQYGDYSNGDEKFTKYGYDSFEAGAIFDEYGNMIKGFLDSHVAYSSKNANDIRKIMK